MAHSKKIIFILLIPFYVLFADETNAKSVYFSSETPYLLQITELLETHNYSLIADSASAEYRGEVFYYLESDSIRCEVQLQKDDQLPFILDSFMTEPEDVGNVRHSVAKFSIWMLFLNALTAILFFIRSN